MEYGQICIKNCTYTVKKVANFVRTKRDFMVSFGQQKWALVSLVLTRKNAKKFVVKKSGLLVSFAKKSGQKMTICTYNFERVFAHFGPFLGLFGAFWRLFKNFVRTKRDFWSIGQFFYLY